MSQTICTRNHVQILGYGSPPILFAHGFGCNQDTWRLLAPLFAPAHQIILFDYVGAGRSERQAYDARRYATLDGYAADVLEICDALELPSCIFVGHSISGMIGARASLQQPGRFQRLVMIGTSPCYVNEENYTGGFEQQAIEELLDLMERNYGGWANFMAPLAIKDPQRPDLAYEIEQTFNAADPAIARQFAEVTFMSDNRTMLGQITCPTLILQCLDDPIVPTSVAEYMHSHIAHSSLQQIHSIGHFPQLSNPQQTAQLIQAYLDSPLAVGVGSGIAP
ncbi:alpha/beta hydrolase [Chloroflexia bacterium SDU3-3]|nr:alpha/beta hydrolase [Chloroflexia bacterium SDU3-3]